MDLNQRKKTRRRKCIIEQKGNSFLLQLKERIKKQGIIDKNDAWKYNELLKKTKIHLGIQKKIEEGNEEVWKIMEQGMPSNTWNYLNIVARNTV